MIHQEIEEWKDVVGFEGIYVVNNFGIVKSIDRQILHKNGQIHNRKSIIISKWQNHKGYELVSLHKENKKTSIPIHIIIAKSFIPNPENKTEVNHKDGNKLKNCVNNLEWNTRLENQQHSVYVLGKHFRGETHKLSKLNDTKVIEIIKLHGSGNYTYASLARKYNMEETQISRIVKRKSWKHLKIQ